MHRYRQYQIENASFPPSWSGCSTSSGLGGDRHRFESDASGGTNVSGSIPEVVKESGTIPHRSPHWPLVINLPAFCPQIPPIVPFLPIQPTGKGCAVNSLRFERFHGMEEVVGSIPTRSTNQPLNTVTALLPTTACNIPARCAFIQLHKVCSTTPRRLLQAGPLPA
jgi:hypothetical protein